jgi:hypothetical protein
MRGERCWAPRWRGLAEVGRDLSGRRLRFREERGSAVGKTKRGKAHSLAVDTDTHRVYAPEQEVDGRPAARMTVYEAVTGQAASLR